MLQQLVYTIWFPERPPSGVLDLLAGEPLLHDSIHPCGCYWPMGIASAGAQRQWGRHATAFVGRRHFDDADLIERRFDLDLDEAP